MSFFRKFFGNRTEKQKAQRKEEIAKQRQKENWKYKDGMSMEQAVNKTKELLKSNPFLAKDKKPITIDDPVARNRFLIYAISLLPKKYEEEKILLALRLKGWSYEKIAFKCGRVPVEAVKKLEATAIDRVKEEITKRRNGGLPIVGG